MPTQRFALVDKNFGLVKNMFAFNGGTYMDYERVKKQANEILRAGSAECSYIEYKASVHQKDRILKTLCAYGNNYYDKIIKGMNS